MTRNKLVHRSALSPIEAEALSFLLPLSSDYPGIDKWYLNKVVPGIRSGTRFLYTVQRDHRLVGLGIAKAEDELKLCTVRVAPDYVGRGIGIRVFDGLLTWLGTDRPHLSVTDYRKPMFDKIFDWYGFEQTSKVLGVYTPHSAEFGYNNVILEPRNFSNLKARDIRYG